jgi:SAM-dependent methyltransferase
MTISYNPIKRIASSILPKFIKQEILKQIYKGNRCFCPLCKSYLKSFLPSGIDAPVITDLQIVGAGFVEQDICPVCKSSYRQRSLLKIVETIRIDEIKPKTILHVAPEESLFSYIRKNINPEKYVLCDINPQRYPSIPNVVKIDITKTDFPDGSFDLILCNHVLEHIPNDRIAMCEIFRILAPNGLAFLQVPISLKLTNTYENPSIITDEQRLNAFGQKDHVRIYGLDYASKLKEIGFNVTFFSLKDKLSAAIINEIKANPEELFFICRKT